MNPPPLNQINVCVNLLGPRISCSQSIQWCRRWCWRCGVWCYKSRSSFWRVQDIWRGSCSLQKCMFFIFSVI